MLRAARTGQGDQVDLSLMDAMLGMLVYECQEAKFLAERRRPLSQPTKARDGFLLMAPVSQKNFEDLARATGHPDWVSDPRFATIHAREHHWGDLMGLLDDWACDKSAADCEAAMNEGGVPSSRYFSVKETMAQPPIAGRGVMQTVNDGSGAFKVPNPGFRFHHTAAHARDSVPELGAGGPTLLRELGCTEADIVGLGAAGVLHLGPASA